MSQLPANVACVESPGRARVTGLEKDSGACRMFAC